MSIQPNLRLIDRLAGRAVARYISLVYSSSTAPPLLDEHIEIFHRLHPFILAMWHGQFMLLPALPRGQIPARVMLALHRDAELMAVALKAHGLELIRGAGAGVRSKDRGGANAFRAAANALESGYSVAMTADVPPGPARRCGHGIVTLAKVSGRPILPVALASSRYLSLNTWSRLTVNLPGSVLGGSIGDPVLVPPNASADELERCRLAVEHQLNIATADAYARAGADPRRATPARALNSDGPQPLSRSVQAYRRATRFVRPVAPLILKRRERAGKEDGARRGERLGIAGVPRPEGKLVWAHAASVGETNAALPLIEALMAARPALNVLLTTGTVASAEIAAQRLPQGVIHQFVPIDVPEYVGRFLDHWRPSLGLFLESEIWPNLVIEASNRQVPLAIVNARMSKETFRSWRKWPSFGDPLFSRFSAVLAQNKHFALRYTQLGVGNVATTGNLKYDAAPLPVDAALKAELLAQMGGRPVWLAASTHAPEEEIAGRVHAALKGELSGLLTIVVPRHPDRGAQLVKPLEEAGLQVALRSRGDRIAASTDLYLADTLGELGTFFSCAPVAFIGKSLSTDGGGHNPIEAIRLGAAVITGSQWFNFDDMFKALFEVKGAVQVDSADALAAAVKGLLCDPAVRARQHAAATAALVPLTGAVQRTLEAVLVMIGDDAAPARRLTVSRAHRKSMSQGLAREQA